MKRIKYWWRKFSDPNFQWGHPDEWDDAEWFYFNRSDAR